MNQDEVNKIITYEYLQEHRTDAGGWTSKQLKIIGIDWPPVKGWMDGVYGKCLTKEEAKAFEDAKYSHKIRKSSVDNSVYPVNK